MEEKRTKFFIINALTAVLLVYSGIRAYYYDKATLPAVLFILVGIFELYFSYTIYKGKWDNIL